MVIKSPCYQCKDRVLGCHDKCVKYQEFRKNKDELNQKIREARAAEDFFIKSKSGLKKYNK